MSLNSFIDRVNDNWPRGVPPTAADDWRRMLSRFSDEQLDSIFDRLLANEHYTPKISDVFKAAKYHGFTDREASRRDEDQRRYLGAHRVP